MCAMVYVQIVLLLQFHCLGGWRHFAGSPTAPSVIPAFSNPMWFSLGTTCRNPEWSLWGSKWRSQMPCWWSVVASMSSQDTGWTSHFQGAGFDRFSHHRFVTQARDLGIPIAVVNIGPTRADAIVDLKIEAKAGDVLPKILLWPCLFWIQENTFFSKL